MYWYFDTLGPQSAGTGLSRTSAGRVAPTAIFSFTVTGATFCVVTYCLIFVRCSGAKSTVAVWAKAPVLISAAVARIMKRFIWFLLMCRCAPLITHDAHRRSA